jgi:hypothetical protein
MTQYTVRSIENNVAKIEFSDGSFSYVELNSSMTEAQLDDIVFQIVPPHLKSGEGTPSFLQENQQRTATEAPAPADD